MAKLQRKTQKIFSSNAATNEHAVFGTMKNIVNNEQPQYSMDVEVLQSGTAFLLGWQNAVVAGFAPFLEEMNGVLYVITSQLAYLLNNGVAEYDSNTTYYQGDIIKVLDNGVPILKYSVIDDNTGNNTNDEDYWTDLIRSTDIPIATTQTPGIVQPDGETITVTPQGVISAQGGANTDLSNLTSSGNAKFQYAPFSINNGSVNSSGKNATLTTPSGSITAETSWIQPVLSSNGTLGSGSFAVSGVLSDGSSGEIYQMFNGGDSSNVFFVLFYYTTPIDMYFGDAVKVSSFTITNGTGNSAGNRAFMSGQIFASDDGSTWTQLTTFTNSTYTAGVSWDINVNSPAFYHYYRLKVNSSTVNTYSQALASHIVVNATYMAQVSTDRSIICSPCTITTADGRTKTFTSNNILNTSGVSTGSYKIVKSYQDGSLSLVNNIFAGSGSIPEDSLLLDNTQYPLTLKRYNGSNWVVDNDLVYLGDATITSGVVNSLINNYFNACIVKHDMVDNYKNGDSWYKIYSDGWCEQGGYSPYVSTNGLTCQVTFLKPFKDTTYYFNKIYSSTSNVAAEVQCQAYGGKTTTSIMIYNYYPYSTGTMWKAEGYIK